MEKHLLGTIRNNLKKDVEELKKLGINPRLAVIMVGEDKASKIQVQNKSMAGEVLGIDDYKSKHGKRGSGCN